jgi:hypothetical protein
MRKDAGTRTMWPIFPAAMLVLFSCGKLTDYSPLNAEAKTLPAIGLKVLILGNSITANSPDSSKAWYGDWGMAASAMDSDYVHVLKRYLSEKFGYDPDVRAASIAHFEQKFPEYADVGGTEIRDLSAFAPDLVVLRIGDNVETAEAIKYDFVSHYGALISYLKRGDSAIVVTTSCWFQKPTVDACMRMSCEQQNVWFVEINDLYNSEENRAESQNAYSDAGVGRHPSNAGMRAIADRLWNVIKTLTP